MNATIESSLVAAAFDADKKKVREHGGNNRGPEVAAYLKSCGLVGAFPWCAAAVTYHLLRAGMPREALPPNPASACSWLNDYPKEYWERVDEPERGDIGGWCHQGKGHLYRIVKQYKLLGVKRTVSLEGNTGPDGGRDGDGFYRKDRKRTSEMKFIRYKG